MNPKRCTRVEIHNVILALFLRNRDPLDGGWLIRKSQQLCVNVAELVAIVRKDRSGHGRGGGARETCVALVAAAVAAATPVAKRSLSTR